VILDDVGEGVGDRLAVFEHGELGHDADSAILVVGTPGVAILQMTRNCSSASTPPGEWE
jgi:hypothetical protein